MWKITELLFGGSIISGHWRLGTSWDQRSIPGWLGRWQMLGLNCVYIVQRGCMCVPGQALWMRSWLEAGTGWKNNAVGGAEIIRRVWGLSPGKYPLFSDEILDSLPWPECSVHLSHRISYLPQLIQCFSHPGLLLQIYQALSCLRTFVLTVPFSLQPSEPLRLMFSPLLFFLAATYLFPS